MHANPQRGEIEVTVRRRQPDGTEVDKAYLLKLRMQAAIVAEKKLGRRFREIMLEAFKGDYECIQAFVFVCLQKYHAAEFPTLESAGDLIDEGGGVDLFFERVAGVLEVDANSIGAGGASDPPAAQTGTSDDSRSTLVGSV